MKKNILFVCTGNSCRSVMAEGLFKDLVKEKADDFLVGSAGVGAMDGYPSSAETIRVMKEHGIDMTGHRSRQITASMVRTADRILVMENMHRNAILSQWPEVSEKTKLLTLYSRNMGGRGMEIDIPDPIRMPPNFYNNVFQVIRECVYGLGEDLGIKREAS